MHTMGTILAWLTTWLVSPPIWPRAAIGAILATVLVAWACVWAGWLGRDWAFWASSSGTLVAAVVVGIWRDTPSL
jgi:hypothetical protein